MIWISVVAFIVAALVAGFIVRWMRSHASVYGNGMPQRFHLGDVPRLGGAALLVSIGCSWGLGVLQSSHWGDPGSLRLGAWACGWLAVLLPAALGGIAEDMTQRLSVRYRLSLTGASGILAVLAMNLHLPRLGLPWLDAMLVAAPWLGVAIVVLAVAGLPHAFNIIDGYNGLAGMVALIVCLALAHVALQVGDRALAALLVSTAAATGGFLVWNYPRGMLFAGDGGAYIWGGVIALASISLVQRNADVSPWFPMLLLIYPVWETVFSIYRKTVRGVSPGDLDHAATALGVLAYAVPTPPNVKTHPVRAPRVAASPASLECRLAELRRLRDMHGDPIDTWLVTGQVVAVHLDPGCIVDEQFLTERAYPILRAGYAADYWRIGPEGKFEMVRPKP